LARKINLIKNNHLLKDHIALKITLLAASSLTVMAGATISPSLPQIQDHFMGTPNAAFLSKLILTMPGLVIALAAPFSGLIIDRYGRKRILILSLLLYGFSGFAGFFINDLILLLISRAVLGLSVAGTMTTTTTLVGDYFKGPERQAFLGYQGAFMALGGVVFILMGGFLADFNWRYPFIIYAASFLILPGAIWILFEPMVKRSSNVLYSELYFSKKWVFINYGIAFVSMMIFYMVPVYIPFLLLKFDGINNFEVGLSISASTFFGAVSSALYRYTKTILNYFQIYALVFGLMGIGYSIIAISSGYGGIIAGLVLNGLGFGMLMPNNNLVLLNLAPEDFRGRILGGVTTFTFIGQFLSPVLFEPLKRNVGTIEMGFQVVSIILLSLFLGMLLFNRSLNRNVIGVFIKG
jgi:MFS family permease